MTEPVSASEVGNLPSLTSLRWYAALLVFLLHIRGQTGFFWRGLGPFGVGYVGVTFFFVLSGFVLTWSAPTILSAGQFYWRRFARIYPLHLACLAIAGVGGLISAQIATTGGLGGLMSVTLTHAWWPGYGMIQTWNRPSWSLAAEAFFYLCFPFILTRFRASRMLAPMVLVSVALAVVITVVLRQQFGIQGAATAYFDPLIRLPEFLVGIWLAVRLQTTHTRLRVPLWAAVLAVLASCVVGWRDLLPYYPLADYVALPSFALLITVAAQHDADGVDGVIEHFLRRPASQYLGTISFAFYLIHDIVISALLLAAGWFHPWSVVDGFVPVVVTFAASLLAAVALHHGVEVPSRKWLLQKRRARSQNALT